MYPIKHHHNPSTQGGWMDRWMAGWMDDDPEQHNQRVAISWCFAEPIMRVDGSWVRKSPSYVSYDGVLERSATIHMRIARPQERTQKCAAECDDNPINQMMTDGHWQFNSQLNQCVCGLRPVHARSKLGIWRSSWSSSAAVKKVHIVSCYRFSPTNQLGCELKQVTPPSKCIHRL